MSLAIPGTTGKLHELQVKWFCRKQFIYWVYADGNILKENRLFSCYCREFMLQMLFTTPS